VCVCACVRVCVCVCLLESKGCYWNISSRYHIVSESDVIEIECEVVYATTSTSWTPVIQCLPETPADDVTDLSSSNVTVTYRRIVTVTSQLNNVKFDCHVSFVAASSSSSSRNNYSSLHLWTSPVINVECKLN